MILKGVQHLAEITRMVDPVTRREHFRYALQREGSAHVIYSGHERDEAAAAQMAQMYLRILDDSAALLRQSADSRSPHLRFVAAPPARATIYRGE